MKVKYRHMDLTRCFKIKTPFSTKIKSITYLFSPTPKGSNHEPLKPLKTRTSPTDLRTRHCIHVG